MRGLLWRASWEQFLQLDPQDLHEVFEFTIQHELQAGLDFGKTSPGNVPAGELQFCGQLGLGPLPSVTDSPHLRPDDVVIFQEFCAFLGAKLGSFFLKNGSAYGATFSARCRRIQRGILSLRVCGIRSAGRSHPSRGAGSCVHFREFLPACFPSRSLSHRDQRFPKKVTRKSNPV